MPREEEGEKKKKKANNSLLLLLAIINDDCGGVVITHRYIVYLGDYMILLLLHIMLIFQIDKLFEVLD